ncbi:hypothetical protein [Microbacterium sp.]|uniref:hypothetical protein n=1 Tax=Microbacterium sp. TaxID=51671 RepID=UPI002810CAC0|nr:hypothetical protein [Microbacterium sp.]
MPEHIWSNDELRNFLSSLRAGGLFGGREVDDDARERFREQALRRVAPEVERRLLADIGTVLDPQGIAAVALEVVEDHAWGARHTWMMVTADPWEYLTELVVREIRRAYRRAVQSRGDAKKLKGIEAASTRRGIT